jgi:hypothetical protein
MSKSWCRTIETSEGEIHLTSYQTADGSTTVIESGPGYYRSIHENQTNDRDLCVHDHNEDGSESKTWYDKDGNFVKTEDY